MVGAHEAAHALNNFKDPKHIKELKAKHLAYIKSIWISITLGLLFFILLILQTELFILLIIFCINFIGNTYSTKNYNKPYQDIYNKDELNAEVTAERELDTHVFKNPSKFTALTQEDKDELIKAISERVQYAQITKNKTWEHYAIGFSSLVFGLLASYIF